MHEYRAKVIKVVDGDTVDVDIDLGFNIWHRNVRIRLGRINAYETRLGKNTTPEQKALGLEAKALVKDWVEAAIGHTVIKTTERGKYGRWIGELIIDTMNVNDELVRRGYAVYQEY